jgi:NAD(P)-dependent dehydrogenase (short-subunit alcohol dehydrogenase family)
MKIQNSVAFVTGGSIGLGAAMVNELLERGARKVYSASRHPGPAVDARVEVVRLDVRDPAAVATAAHAASDVSILCNIAGAYLGTPLLTADLDLVRDELETNVVGLISMARAFAPVLAANGGGAMLNVHSLLSWLSAADAYSASRAATWSVTNGLRALLGPSGTLVTGLHVGFMDTPLTAAYDVPKSDPRDVARSALDGVEAGADEVLADEDSRSAKQLLSGDPARLVVG